MKYYKSKYGSSRVKINGLVFDSKAEAERWAELKLLQRVGKISDLRRQVTYTLIPAQPLETPRVYPDGHRRLCESPVAYKADFVYKDEAGVEVVEDVKGMSTTEYVLKRKLMKWLYGIEIKEVRRE